MQRLEVSCAVRLGRQRVKHHCTFKFFVRCLNNIPKCIYLSPVVVMEVLCESKLGLVASTAGTLAMRMRHELWCHPSLVRWRGVRKLFMLWVGSFSYCLLSYRSWVSIAQRQPEHGYRTHYMAFICEIWKIWRWWVCRMFCLLGRDAAYFRNEHAAAILVLQDGGSMFHLHSGIYLP